MNIIFKQNIIKAVKKIISTQNDNDGEMLQNWPGREAAPISRPNRVRARNLAQAYCQRNNLDF